MPLNSIDLQPLMMVAGLSLVCWLLIRGKLRRRTGAVSKIVQPGGTLALGHNANAQLKFDRFTGTQSLGAPAEVLKWQVELHDLGRELKGELDSKLVAVRAMSTSYDQAARRLSDLIRLAEQTCVSDESPLAEARRLHQCGWNVAAIARALNFTESQVAQLLSLPEPTDPAP